MMMAASESLQVESLAAAEHVSANAGEPLRILAVGNMYPPHHVGGYELAWQHSMRRARALGHTVRVLTTDYLGDPHLQEEDPDVHRALRWYWDLHRYEFPDLNPLQRLGLELHNARTLRSHLRDFAPHVVSWWPMGCMSLSMIGQVRQAGLPSIFLVHDDWLGYGVEHDQWIHMWSGPRRQLAGRLVQKVCRIPTSLEIDRAGPLVFNSEYTRRRAAQLGVAPRSSAVIYPGIDETFLEALPPREWGWRVAYIGRLDRQKGVDTGVAALAKLPASATLTVWGSGDQAYVAEMRAQAHRLGVGSRLVFNGFAGQQALRAAYAQADVVIFPVRWNEPFGLVPLEAMGMGCPVVSTARGGAAEFIRDGENALVFNADDAEGLASCIRRLGDDERLRAKLREQGSVTAARFTASRSAELTVAAIVQAAGRPTGA